MRLGQEDPYIGQYDPTLFEEPPPDAGMPGHVYEPLMEITLPDVVAVELANERTGFEVTYAGETWTVADTPLEAVRVALHTSSPDILGVYESTPEADTAAAEYVQAARSGGSTQGWADRWLPRIGDALVRAIPDALNRVFSNPHQPGQYIVRAQTSTIPWTPILIGAAALFVLPKLLRKGSRSGRRAHARR